MRLPPRNAAYQQRVRYGYFVARALEVAELPEQAQTVLALSQALLAAGRAYEDAALGAFSAGAPRKLAERKLAQTAKNGRAQLGGRSTRASREKPYILVYPDKIVWYTAASQADQVPRYTLLSSRLRSHLPEGDPVRASAAVIDEGIAALQAGDAVQQAAELALAEKRAALSTLEADFDEAMVKLHGALQEKFGSKEAADALFP